MALGGGVWVTQNKILPGSYVNIVSASKATATGGHRDVAHPIDKDTRKMFEDAIFEEYNKAE